MSKLFVAYFDDEQAILGATRDAREQGFTIHDVFTPYAVHGMDEAMGLRRSRLTWVCFGAGLVGLVFAAFFQYWASAINWPLNVGGKPHNSFPAYVPVSFELMVLFAGLATVAALFIRARLRPLKREKILLPRVTDDRFALALETQGSHFDERAARALCARWGAVETTVIEVGS